MQIQYETIRGLEKRIEAIELFINAAIEAEKQKKTKSDKK